MNALNSESLGSMKISPTHTVITNYAIHMHSVCKYDIFCQCLGIKYDQPKFAGLLRWFKLAVWLVKKCLKPLGLTSKQDQQNSLNWFKMLTF